MPEIMVWEVSQVKPGSVTLGLSAGNWPAFLQPMSRVSSGSLQHRRTGRRSVAEMIKPVAIDHIVLRTDRYAELIEFYCTVLGCSKERATSREFGLTQLRAGSALIDIVDVSGELGVVGGPAPGETGNNVDHFCLQIEPFAESDLQAYLRDCGVEAGDFEERYGAQGMGRSIYIKDLAGNTVELRSVK